MVNRFRLIAKRLLYIKTWQLIILLFALIGLSIFFLRQNNLTMIEKRQAIQLLDEETGDIKQLEPLIIDLGEFVLNHMNSDMGGPLELPGTYNKAVDEGRAKAAKSGTANAEIYAKAQQACEDWGIPLPARAKCMQDYITDNAAPGTDAEDFEFPDKVYYSYNFTSPAWSPDMAGMFTLLSFITFTWITLRMLSQRVFPRIINFFANDPLE